MSVNKRPTIRDIAAASRVSRGTVDRVLNNRGEVNEETKRKVLRKAAELDYRPNHAARALARQKPLRIGVICPSQPDYFWDEVILGITDAGKELEPLGVEILFRSTGARDARGEAMLVEQLTAKGVDGLAVAPSNEAHLQEALAAGIKAGTPVVLLNNDIPQLDRLCFIGADSLRAGQAAGGLLGKLMSGRGKAVVVAGFKDVLSQQQRVAGIHQVLRARYPGIEIVAVLENFDDGQNAYRAIGDMLDAAPAIDGIVVTNACVGGVGLAVLDHAKAHQIKIVGFDSAADTLDLIRRDVVDATICQSPYQQGFQSVRLLGRYLLYGEKPPAEVQYTKLEVVVAELLADPHP